MKKRPSVTVTEKCPKRNRVELGQRTILDIEIVKFSGDFRIYQNASEFELLEILDAVSSTSKKCRSKQVTLGEVT